MRPLDIAVIKEHIIFLLLLPAFGLFLALPGFCKQGKTNKQLNRKSECTSEEQSNKKRKNVLLQPESSHFRVVFISCIFFPILSSLLSCKLLTLRHKCNLKYLNCPINFNGTRSRISSYRHAKVTPPPPSPHHFQMALSDGSAVCRFKYRTPSNKLSELTTEPVLVSCNGV